MKKIITTALAALMIVSTLALGAFADNGNIDVTVTRMYAISGPAASTTKAPAADKTTVSVSADEYNSGSFTFAVDTAIEKEGNSYGLVMLMDIGGSFTPATDVDAAGIVSCFVGSHNANDSRNITLLYIYASTAAPEVPEDDKDDGSNDNDNNNDDNNDDDNNNESDNNENGSNENDSNENEDPIVPENPGFVPSVPVQAPTFTTSAVEEEIIEDETPLAAEPEAEEIVEITADDTALDSTPKTGVNGANMTLILGALALVSLAGAVLPRKLCKD